MRRHEALARIGVAAHLEVELVALDTAGAPVCSWCGARRAVLHAVVELAADDDLAEVDDDQLGEVELDSCGSCLDASAPFLWAAVDRALRNGGDHAAQLADAAVGVLVRLGLGALAESVSVTVSGTLPPASTVTTDHIG